MSQISIVVALYENASLSFHYMEHVNVIYISPCLVLCSSHICSFSMQKRKDEATEALDSLYNEIRPAIEEHERDTQDSVSTTVAEKWIQACCLKLKAEFDLYSSIVKNVACTAPKSPGQAKTTEVDIENKIKLLTD